MAIALDGTAFDMKRGFGTSATPLVLAGVTAGSMIYVAMMTDGAESPTCTDDKSSTYSTPRDIGGASQDIATSYALNTTGGTTTITCTWSGSRNYTVWAAAFTGVKTTSAGDGENSQITNGPTTANFGSITTTASGDLVIGVLHGGGNANTYTQSGSWLIIQEDESAASGVGGVMVYQIVGAAGAYNPAVTLGTGSAVTCVSSAFLEATGGGGGTTQNLFFRRRR